MNQTLRDLAIATIRSMHPELDERGVLDQHIVIGPTLGSLHRFLRLLPEE